MADLKSTFLNVYSVLKKELLQDPAFEWSPDSREWVERVVIPFFLSLVESLNLCVFPFWGAFVFSWFDWKLEFNCESWAWKCCFDHGLLVCLVYVKRNPEWFWCTKWNEVVSWAGNMRISLVRGDVLRESYWFCGESV